MPILLEQLQHPTDQDLRDLAAIYPDHPLPTWLRERQLAGQTLWAGRFNDRLLGAVWATPAVNTWRLTDLQVRANTRRRGVATQLLTLLCKRADADRIDLQLPAENAEVIAPVLQTLGFELDDRRCDITVWARAPHK